MCCVKFECVAVSWYQKVTSFNVSRESWEMKWKLYYPLIATRGRCSAEVPWAVFKQVTYPQTASGKQ